MNMPYPEDCLYFNVCTKAGDGMCATECGAFCELPEGSYPPLDETCPFTGTGIPRETNGAADTKEK